MISAGPQALLLFVSSVFNASRWRLQPLCFLQQAVLCTKNRLCYTDDGDTAAGILEDPRKYSALVVVVRGPTAPQRCTCKPSYVVCVISWHALCLTTKASPLASSHPPHVCHALLSRSLYLSRSFAHDHGPLVFNKAEITPKDELIPRHELVPPLL